MMESGGFSWSRFGPIVPDAPAAANVWQLAQFVEKIVLPSVALPPAGLGSAPLTPAVEATYAATSSSAPFWSVTQPCGLPFVPFLQTGKSWSGGGIGGLGSRIWSST